MISKIHVRGRFEATRFDQPYRVLVISITDPGSDKPKFNNFCVMDDKDVLRLEFHDVDPTLHDEELLAGYIPMHEFHAKQIPVFLKNRLREGVDSLLVHCEAGISRSPATALAICDKLGLDRSIVDWRGHVVPNEWVYSKVYLTNWNAMC